jgi:hypothetical protein
VMRWKLAMTIVDGPDHMLFHHPFSSPVIITIIHRSLALLL